MAAMRAPSAIRSHVESSTAPNFVPPPLARAIAPSSRSSITKPHTVNVPASRWPAGKSHIAKPTAPAVPMSVIAFGVSPMRTSQTPIGSVTRETEARAKMFSMGRASLVQGARFTGAPAA
jgi:hypothetical protein